MIYTSTDVIYEYVNSCRHSIIPKFRRTSAVYYRTIKWKGKTRNTMTHFSILRIVFELCMYTEHHFRIWLNAIRRGWSQTFWCTQRTALFQMIPTFELHTLRINKKIVSHFVLSFGELKLLAKRTNCSLANFLFFIFFAGRGIHQHYTALQVTRTERTFTKEDLRRICKWILTCGASSIINCCNPPFFVYLLKHTVLLVMLRKGIFQIHEKKTGNGLYVAQFRRRFLSAEVYQLTAVRFCCLSSGATNE